MITILNEVKNVKYCVLNNNINYFFNKKTKSIVLENGKNELIIKQYYMKNKFFNAILSVIINFLVMIFAIYSLDDSDNEVWSNLDVVMKANIKVADNSIIKVKNYKNLHYLEGDMQSVNYSISYPIIYSRIIIFIVLLMGLIGIFLFLIFGINSNGVMWFSIAILPLIIVFGSIGLFYLMKSSKKRIKKWQNFYQNKSK
ncbi:MAG: hypothetical protein WCR54_06965 [Clostridia bacterium]